MNDTGEPALHDKLNRETALIPWRELQVHYARGAVIGVGAGLDLLDVAEQLAADNTECFQQWLAEGSIARVDDAQAGHWFEQDASLWAVVVAPWVLVQAPAR